MSEQIEEFYANIYKLAYITRYSGVPRIKDESVAEHSFFVASLVIKLHEAFEFDLGEALQMAITHDWSESYIGDITMRTRRNYPSLNAAVELAEFQAMKNNFNKEVTETWLKYSKQDCVEAKIVLLADILQVIQYAEHEVKLGNDGYMQEVVDSAHSRLEQLSGELYAYKR